MMRTGLAIAVLSMLAACSQPAAAPPKPDSAASFAVSLLVTPAPGGSVQRVTLPAAAVAAIRRADAGDVRIFDVAGQVISIARTTAGDASARRESHRVPTARTASRTINPAQSSVKLKVEQAGQAVIVDATDPAGPAGRMVETLILDTRQLADPAAELTLDAAVPEHLELAVMVDQSSDLAEWRPAATKVLFRFDPSAPDPDVNRIKLGGTALKGQYLRISWAPAPGVVISGAQVVTVKQLSDPDLALPASGARLIDPHTFSFAVPLALAPSALRLTALPGTGVVPLRLEGRSRSDAAWHEISAAPLRGGESAVLVFSADHFAQYRVSADPRSAGFGALPTAELLLAPVHVLAAFNNKPPYRLAVGNPAAPPAYFAPGELLGEKSSADLPQAVVAAAANLAEVSLTPAADAGRFPARTIALWTALLAATAVLAFAAIRLMRANGAAGPTPPAD